MDGKKHKQSKQNKLKTKGWLNITDIWQIYLKIIKEKFKLQLIMIQLNLL